MMTNYNHFEEKSLKNQQKSCFFAKVTLKKQKKPEAGKLATEVRSGDAPKPPFPMVVLAALCFPEFANTVLAFPSQLQRRKCLCHADSEIGRNFYG